MNIINKFKFIKKTPLIYSNRLSELYNCNIYLKREDLQTTRSFKIRGALNKIYKHLLNNGLLNGGLKNKEILKNNLKIVTTSAGNHAQGVSYICDYFDINCNIYIPREYSTTKNKCNKKI